MSKFGTCLKVGNAFNEELKSRSIDRVKVTDPCQTVGISRATFYDYFNDVYAVSTWFWGYLMTKTLYQTGLTLDCYEAHLRKFEALRTHNDFFTNAFKVTGYESGMVAEPALMARVFTDSMPAFLRELLEPEGGGEAPTGKAEA